MLQKYVVPLSQECLSKCVILGYYCNICANKGPHRKLKCKCVATDLNINHVLQMGHGFRQTNLNLRIKTVGEPPCCTLPPTQTVSMLMLDTHARTKLLSSGLIQVLCMGGRHSEKDTVSHNNSIL